MQISSESLPKRTSEHEFWPRELALGLLPLLLSAQVLAWLVYLPMGLHGIADFRQLYSGGYIVRVGRASQLYDYDKQQEIEDKLVPLGAKFLLPINHPAYEELVFAPFSFFPYRVAFIIFLFSNIVILVCSARVLVPLFGPLLRRWFFFPILLVVSFFPVTRALAQGQDSVLLLALFVGAMVSLREGRAFQAGLLAGAGVFKFQIAVPIALAFILWRRWRFVLGFGLSSAIAVLISMAMVGINGIRQYASLMSSMSVNFRPGVDELRYATIDNEMLNIRGLFSSALGSFIPHGWVQGLIVIASLAVLLLLARSRPSFAFAILAASLVSYHLIAHDATPLLIPFGLALCADSTWVALAGTAGFVLPLTAIVPRYGFIGSIPTLALFLMYVSGNKQLQEQFATVGRGI